MNKLVNWLKSEGINVFMLEMNKEGICLLSKNTILVSSKLAEFEQIKVIHHELKHFEHKDYIALYRQFIYHSKMENEAEQNVVEKLLNEYITYFDGDLDKINYMTFLESYELDSSYDKFVVNLLNKLKEDTRSNKTSYEISMPARIMLR